MSTQEFCPRCKCKACHAISAVRKSKKLKLAARRRRAKRDRDLAVALLQRPTRYEIDEVANAMKSIADGRVSAAAWAHSIAGTADDLIANRLGLTTEEVASRRDAYEQHIRAAVGAPARCGSAPWERRLALSGALGHAAKLQEQRRLSEIAHGGKRQPDGSVCRDGVNVRCDSDGSWHRRPCDTPGCPFSTTPAAPPTP